MRPGPIDLFFFVFPTRPFFFGGPTFFVAFGHLSASLTVSKAFRGPEDGLRLIVSGMLLVSVLCQFFLVQEKKNREDLRVGRDFCLFLFLGWR